MIRKYHPSAKVHSEQGSRPVTLHGQASTVLWAKVETRSVGGSLTALVDQSENDLPEHLKIVPSLIELRMDGKDQLVPVEVFNSADGPVSLRPRTVLSMLQSVSVISGFTGNMRTELDSPAELGKKELDVTFPVHMSKDQVAKASKLLSEWNRKVFAQHDFDLGRTSKMRHAIPVNDSQPFKQ